MAGGFLNKLLGHSSVPDAIAPALDELSRLAEARSSLAGPAAVLKDLLPLLYDGPVPFGAPSIRVERAADKLTGGVPLLRGETLSADERALGRRWQRVCEVLKHRTGDEAALALRNAAREGRLRPFALLQHILAGNTAEVPATAEALDLEAGLTATVLRLTCFPSLTLLQETLASLRVGIRWPAGYCPVCGSWPLLGEFRGLEQTRFLRCGFCAAEWEFQRLCCPFCGERDHQALGYFHVENEEARYRAATCESCRGYIKTVTTLAILNGPQLLAADLSTLHLDLAAAERGYGPPA